MTATTPNWMVTTNMKPRAFSIPLSLFRVVSHSTPTLLLRRLFVSLSLEWKSGDVVLRRKKAAFQGPPYIWEQAILKIQLRSSATVRVLRFWLIAWFFVTLGVGTLLLSGNALVREIFQHV
jgi:hypothetical protein